MIVEELIEPIKEAQLLGIFKRICEKNSSSQDKHRLRNILALSSNKIETIKKIIKRDFAIDLTDYESQRLLELLNAYLTKSNYRKPLDENTKKKLLIKQNNQCAICHCNIEHNYHADHIVPFKYVGDMLENNWQMLCSNCNEKKNASIDYQIKYLLNLV